jgi:hypothetical protein
MLRILAVLTALGALRVLASSTPGPNVNVAEPVLYFPTKVGAKWVYDDDGWTYTMVVTKVERKGDAALVTVSSVFPDGWSQHFETMEVSRTGLREVENFYRKYDAPVPRLRIPHLSGAKWESPIRLDGQDRGRSEMLAGPTEDVKVPAGTYRAVRVETLSTCAQTEQRLTHWYAPRVGLVRVKYRPGSSRDLKSFDPGKDQ